MSGRSVVRRLLGATALGGAGWAAWRQPKVRSVVRAATRGVRRRARYGAGRADGWLYRVGMGGPDPDVPDDIVAERIRAALGPVVHRLDVPHVHVMVEHHVALLHGDVGTDNDRRAIENAVRKVSGVQGVESHLHVGLLPGDTRPSAGHQRSHDLAALVDAARRHGGGEVTAVVAVKAVLGTLAAMLPEHDRTRLASHLPPDVARLLVAPRRVGRLRFVQDVAQLRAVIAATGLVAPAHADAVLRSVLAELRRMVATDDAADVGALLPPGLRALWEAPTPIS